MDNVITNNVDGYLKSASLTGNPFIDSLIIASLVPIVIAYINGVFNFFRSLCGHVWKFFQVYISDKVKTKLTGKVLCVVKVFENNKLFSIINKIIFSDDVSSDIDGNIFKKICSITNDKTLQEHYERISYYDTYTINIDYSGKKLFTINKEFSNDFSETKVFKYKDYYVKFSAKNTKDEQGEKKTNCRSNIMIELVSFKTANLNKDEYGLEIEEFLKDRFGIFKNIPYVYSVKTTNNLLAEHLSRFITRGMIGGAYGPLKYGSALCGDMENEDSDCENIVSSHLTLNTKNKNISKSENLEEELLITNSTNASLNTETGENTMVGGRIYNGTAGIYMKYVDKTWPNYCAFGHYQDSNKLVIIGVLQNNSGQMVASDINIVSFGKIFNLDDIKKTIEFMIKIGTNTQVVLPGPKPNKRNVLVYKYSNGWINYSLDKRSFDNIFIKDNTMSELKKEMESFFRVERLYRECELPYRKGILLYGPPGTGKTSLVKALAYEYQINVYMVNINDSFINDDTIVDMLNVLGGGDNKILLFEDIDSAFADKEKVKFGEKKEKYDVPVEDSNNKMAITTRKYLTYAGLLNALDGVLSNHHGVITIMTTNYIEKLGDALIRPGRIDHKYYLGPSDRSQIIKMTSHIIKKSIDIMKEKQIDNSTTSNSDKFTNKYVSDKIQEFAKRLVNKDDSSKINPCKLQQYILKNIGDLDDIFANYRELLD